MYSLCKRLTAAGSSVTFSSSALPAPAQADSCDWNQDCHVFGSENCGIQT
jgi:hypothetical protein